MRRLAIVIPIAVVVLVAIVLAVALSNVDKYRPRVQAELQQKLDRPVTLGHLGVRLLPLSIRVDGLTIGESPEFASRQSFATAKEVYVSVGFFSLLTGNPDVKELDLNRPQIELIRNSAGVWNFSTIGGAPAGHSMKPSGNSGELSLDELKMTDGQVAVTDQVTKEPRSVYDHIDLKLTDFGPHKQFGIDVALHFPGPGKELLAFNGKAGPLESGNTPSLPLNGDFSLQEVSLAGVNRLSPGTIPAQTDGVVSGKGTLSSSNELLACKGNLKLENTTIRGAKLDYPVEAEYDFSDDRKQNKIQVRSGLVKLGSTSFSVTGAFALAQYPAKNMNVDATVKTNGANIADLLNLAKAYGLSSAEGATGTGTLSLNAHVQGATSATSQLVYSGSAQIPNATVKTNSSTQALVINSANVQFAQNGASVVASAIKAQGFVLNNVHANAKFDAGVVQLSPVTSDVFGGKENGTVSVDTRPVHPLCSVKINLSGVDTNALLSAVSTMKDTLYGSMAADTDLNFTLESGADLARTLNGNLNFNVTNGQLKNINILNELSHVAKFLNSAPSQTGSGTALKRFSGTLNIVNGVATTNNLMASLDAGSLSANGSLNLVSEGLDLHMTAVLGSGASQSAGGTHVGGFFNTALANNNGELVVPVTVTGTMAHPVFTPDLAAIAKMKLSNLLPTSGDPSKLTSGLVGSVLGNKGAGGVLGGILGNGAAQPGQKNNPQQNPLGGLLQQFGKKKPKQ